jgi:hypothetical protein
VMIGSLIGKAVAPKGQFILVSTDVGSSPTGSFTHIMDNIMLDTSPEALAILREYWKPGGSGPLSAMKLITKLINALAEEKGYDLDAINVVYRDGKFIVESD